MGAAIAVALGGQPALAAIGLGWWLVVLLMLDWHLGMLERLDGRPLEGLGPANVLSLVRSVSVPLLIVVPPIALAFILLAGGMTDVLDGRIARRRDEVTRLGLWLDPAVDALVLAVAAGVLADRDRLSPWVAALVIARYLLPWTVVTAAYFARAEAPSRTGYVSGRAAGVLVLVGLALAGLRFPAGSPVVVIGAAGGLFAFTLTVARTLRTRSQVLRG